MVLSTVHRAMEHHPTKAVLIGFNAFVILVLFVLYIITGTYDFLAVAGVLFFLGFVGKFAKYVSFVFMPEQSARPLGASGCRSFYGWPGASVTGMPSGHAMGAAAMAVIAHEYIRRNQQTQSFQSAGVIFVYGFSLLIAFSRVVYNCHTLAQIFIGYMVGFAYGWLSVKYVLPSP